ncbi:transglutaminase-like protein [Aeromicrobium marinum DSM 15272]|uniref:Transglutaminase-like protein n=1 Tax=Aeromicrobium marinum DSM 15272 TaxID=585531 RepID=E2SD61_9ACTN|nr:transglutaminase family protein [Aeromicrobium marinum]EFQ83164.1 transglutaminase-like protein [Aeromicrobium marinum DSM 15272]
MRYRVRHTTTYTYDDDVTDSYGVAYLAPRQLPWQQVTQHAVVVDPRPADTGSDTDYYGNTATYFQVDEPHTRLRIEADSTVEVVAEQHDRAVLGAPWEQARPSARPDVLDAWSAGDFALRSPLVDHTDEAFAYAARSLLPGRPIGEAATELMHRIHTDFEYEQGATTVSSTIDDVFGARAGVCQDFAHLSMACLRSHGLAVRYVSGYLATDPPPGKERIVGADASHAWAAVWLPGDGWLALDPTNDQPVGDRYVTVAWGRDYADVPPVKGVIFTEAKTSNLAVEVDVAPC